MQTICKRGVGWREEPKLHYNTIWLGNLVSEWSSIFYDQDRVGKVKGL